MSLNELVKKYDVPVPRYTSYPTVPYWDIDTFTSSAWHQAVEKCFVESNKTKGISLYIHLPFCESLCTYCACNTRITKNHTVEDKYIDAVLMEWESYKTYFNDVPVIREIHLGGGTPTFFNAFNLQRLINKILAGCIIHPDHEFSFEGHPNNTTALHLQTLYDLGFRRVSFGVQDLDYKVQKTINRIQPVENVERVVRQSRMIGYKSISFDLIYGLPYQTLVSVTHTMKKVIELKPDRIAFYSYAHVPWIKPGQRGYEDADLPSDILKRSLYEAGRKQLLENKYTDVGMDHFALSEDSLTYAQRENRLHRNFMGYTTNQTDLLIGLGTSSISDAKYAYAQNVKKVEEYQAKVFQHESPILKGHLHTADDLMMRKIILDIACKGRIATGDLSVTKPHIKNELNNMEAEQLLIMDEDGYKVTERGRVFIRNICALFDQRMKDGNLQRNQTFSKSI